MTSETSALARDGHPQDRPRPTRPFTRRGHQATGARTGRLHVPADRAALARLLVATGLLYLWGLGASGWGDTAGTASQIAGWVESTFTAHTVDGITVYDPTSGG